MQPNTTSLRVVQNLIDECARRHPCRNGAFCNMTAPTEPTCYCNPGWEGTLCDALNTTCVGSVTCQNSGTCYDVINATPDSGFYCS